MQPPQVEQEQEQEGNWIRRTSQKILAISAGLVAFLKYTDRVLISPEPIHEPDMEFVKELVQLLQHTAPTSQKSAGDD